MATEEPLWKRPWEEIFFYHQFKRIPTPGWLGAADSIASITSVGVYNSSGSLMSGAILSYSITSQTKVVYKVGSTLPAGTYEVRIRIVSSTGEKFEDHAALEVIST